jgi:hypothetical protein
MVGKFGLLPFLDAFVPAHPEDPVWEQTDYAIKSWLYTSVNDSVLDLAIDNEDQTACALYTAIANLFNDNKESRAIYLSNEFHTVVQGDSSVADYCQRVKSLTDSLHDVDHGVSETQLVLNLLRGLNPKFSNTANNITNTTPFPSFSKARSMLALKESMIANETKVVSETALTATASTSPCPPGGCAGTGNTGANQGGRGGGGGNRGRDGRNGRGRGRNNRGGGTSGNSGQGPALWRTPPPTDAGLLGSAPSVFQSAYNTTYAPLQMPSASVLPPPAQWDQAALVAALNNMAPPSQARWVMDSGATSHMSSDNGIVPSLIPLPSPVFVTVGNGKQVPVRFYSNIHLCLPSSNFVLNSVLRVPSLIKNLISVRQFTRDNAV